MFCNKSIKKNANYATMFIIPFYQFFRCSLFKRKEEGGLIMKYNYDINESHQSTIIGNSVDVSMRDVCHSEIKANIIVKELDTVRLWGQVKDCKGRPIANVTMKLLKYECGEYNGIAHTVTDCQGFYQFDLPKKNPKAKFKVIASKANTGSEKVINSSSLNCFNCDADCSELEENDEHKHSHHHHHNHRHDDIDDSYCSRYRRHSSCGESRHTVSTQCSMCETCEYFDTHKGCCSL
jgi:hypothetical protein